MIVIINKEKENSFNSEKSEKINMIKEITDKNNPR